MRRWRNGVVGTVAFVGLACGAAGGGTSAVDLALLDVPSSRDEGFGVEEVTPEAPLLVTEDFRVVYAYRGRTATSAAGRFEYRVADPRDADPHNDSVLLASSAGGALDCSLGCFLDRGLRYVAVVTASSSDGQRVRVFDLGQPVALVPLEPEVPDVAHVAWADGVLYYSRRVECPTGTAAVTRCFDVFRFNPAAPGGPVRLTQMPPVEEEGLTTAFQYNGTFTIGEDGESLIFFIPTNVSLSIWMYRDGLRRKLLGPICAAKDPYGNCITPPGGSSMYREDNPVALSRDGKTLVFPLLEENRRLLLYRYVIGDPEPRFSTLLSVPSDYLKNACYNRQPWQFTEVRGPLRFSHDGSEVLFIGASSCDENDRKPWTNILRLDVDRIGSGTPLQEADFEKVTDNPQGYTSRAIAISSFDLSPSGEYVVLVGTPTVDMEGQPLPAQPDGRHERDREVHVTRIAGGSRPLQITNDVEWRAEWLLAVPAP